MFATRLMQLLADGGITPGNIRPLAELCNEWFAAEPGIAVFTLRSIFNELFSSCDDQQGIPTSVYAILEIQLLPRLKAVAPFLGSGHQKSLEQNLDDLVKAYHLCRMAAGGGPYSPA